MNLWGDVTVGTLLNYALFGLLDHYAVKYGIEELKSGMYVTEDVNLVTTDQQGDFADPDANLNYKIWFLQLTVWCIIVLISKIITFIAPSSSINRSSESA